MLTSIIVSCLGVTKTNNRPKVMKKLFSKVISSHTAISSSPPISSTSNILSTLTKEVSICLNRLSLEKYSHRPANGKTLEEGFEFAGKSNNGVAKEKVSRGGWEGERNDWRGVLEKDRGSGKGGSKGGKMSGPRHKLMNPNARPIDKVLNVTKCILIPMIR